MCLKIWYSGYVFLIRWPFYHYEIFCFISDVTLGSAAYYFLCQYVSTIFFMNSVYIGISFPAFQLCFHGYNVSLADSMEWDQAFLLASQYLPYNWRFKLFALLHLLMR